jgi:2-dehydro-3-deoxygalactonokinase
MSPPLPAGRRCNLDFLIGVGYAKRGSLMSGDSFVAGDWGTSHLRLFLCDESGNVLGSVNGPGAAAGDFARVFDSLVARWPSSGHVPPAVLSGMVGSSIGWIQAPYLACPVRPWDIAAACASVREGQIRIIPGLSCRNRFDAPDVMRGEETQILGALELQPDLRQGRRLLCLPGTHTKWVLLQEGVIHDFLTAPTGELFTLLRDRSVLVREPGAADSDTSPAFERALVEVQRFSAAQVLHRLFECRSRTLAGDLGSHEAAAFLSGLLIASDITGALSMFGPSLESRAVHLIGAPQLTELYAKGLACQDQQVSTTDGVLAAVAGLSNVRRQLTGGLAPHAH